MPPPAPRRPRPPNPQPAAGYALAPFRPRHPSRISRPVVSLPGASAASRGGGHSSTSLFLKSCQGFGGDDRVEIRPIRTKRFRGFTYNTPAADEILPVTTLPITPDPGQHGPGSDTTGIRWVRLARKWITPGPGMTACRSLRVEQSGVLRDLRTLRGGELMDVGPQYRWDATLNSLDKLLPRVNQCFLKRKER
jgi:hypothetical protein